MSKSQSIQHDFEDKSLLKRLNQSPLNQPNAVPENMRIKSKLSQKSPSNAENRMYETQDSPNIVSPQLLP